MGRLTASFHGGLPEIIRNDRQLYEGNLIPYFQAVFNNAKNLQHPYHNFRHMFHVLYLCYQACLFYQDQGKLMKRQMRHLLIAALFHDFDHSGKMGNDDLNIILAKRGLDKHIIPMDLAWQAEIKALINATEFPHTSPTAELDLPGQIIRDADLGQSFSAAWIQQVIFGLAAEWGKKPIEVLRMQESFHINVLKFYTAWGQKMFPQADIDAKVAEAKELIELLESPVTTT